MADSGLGVDGYARLQQETTYGTAVTSSMTDLPAHNDSNVTVNNENIENDNQISSRLKQDPQSGRRVITGNVPKMDVWPTLTGQLLHNFLGAATTSGPTDTTVYTHYWLQPLTGQTISKSFTYQQAKGSDLADTFDGGKINVFNLNAEVGGNFMVECESVFQSVTEDVARVSSFTYPTTVPFSFCNAVLNVNPTGVSAFDQSIDNFNLSVNLNYDTERFKLGSCEIIEPQFNAKPEVTLSCTIDADSQFVGYARDHTEIDLTLTITSETLVAGAASTFYTYVIELPGCRLNPENDIENSNERLKMDLEFDCGYGGTSTNSGSDSVMFEMRLLDETSAYS